MFKQLQITSRVAFLLAVAQIRRSNRWPTILAIFVMTLTFLNLVVVSGILVGLVEGSITAVRTRYTSDLFISNLKNKPYISHSANITKLPKRVQDLGIS